MIVFEVEFGKPHALAEREQDAPFGGSGFPTDCPVGADFCEIGLYHSAHSWHGANYVRVKLSLAFAASGFVSPF